jgi:hypothetical protein
VCVCLRGYINGSRGWICWRLASAMACGVTIAAADPATSWDDPGNPPGDGCAPPLAPGSCDPPGFVPATSCVYVSGAPPSCDPLSSSCGGTLCKKSNVSKLKSSNPPAWSSRVESGVPPLHFLEQVKYFSKLSTFCKRDKVIF